MPYRKEQFANDQYYHVLNRGIDGRNIFENKVDYERYLDCLKEFNTSEYVTIRDRRYRASASRSPIPAAPLIEIICFCLLPNHFHLLLKQAQENGIQTFMRKVGIGYTNYFNLKHQRKGHLFQGVFQAVPILKESHFLHISRYIHLNVLDLFEPKWREGKIDSWDKAKNFLEKYPWSSYPGFIGRKKFDFCRPDCFTEIFKTSAEYEQFLKDWTERSLGEVSEIILE